MSSRKKEEGFSRRGFIRGLGVGTGTLGAAVLPAETLAAAPAAAKVLGPGPVPVTLNVNGQSHQLQIEPRVTLLDALRDRLDYTGPKRVCDRGTCGACTVLLDGKAVYACSVLAIDARGKQIRTIESLPATDAVVEAFVRHDAQQCGFCTPGFVMASHALLARTPHPTPEQIEHGLSGNLCRCGTYMGIRQAVQEAAKSAKGGGNA